MKLMEQYKPRSVRFLELWQPQNWRIKVYGIVYDGERPEEKLVTAAKEVALAKLQKSAPDTNHYSVGFLGIHQGRGANFVFIDWWADENELHHHVYNNSGDNPDELIYILPDGPSACCWDVAVIAYEREAWVKHILQKPDNPDLESYLQDCLNENL